MGSQPLPTTNAQAQTVNSIISALASGAIATAELFILADMPWLGLPFIKQIWEGIFNWIAQYFVRAVEFGATGITIQLQVANQESNLSDSLKNLMAAEKSGDQAAIAIAIQAYAAANSKLTHSDGVAPPQ